MKHPIVNTEPPSPTGWGPKFYRTMLWLMPPCVVAFSGVGLQLLFARFRWNLSLFNGSGLVIWMGLAISFTLAIGWFDAQFQQGRATERVQVAAFFFLIQLFFVPILLAVVMVLFALIRALSK